LLVAMSSPTPRNVTTKHMEQCDEFAAVCAQDGQGRRVGATGATPLCATMQLLRTHRVTIRRALLRSRGQLGA
jgi:hypothetical protein